VTNDKYTKNQERTTVTGQTEEKRTLTVEEDGKIAKTGKPLKA
jgi:hypothetical protein